MHTERLATCCQSLGTPLLVLYLLGTTQAIVQQYGVLTILAKSNTELQSAATAQDSVMRFVRQLSLQVMHKGLYHEVLNS